MKSTLNLKSIAAVGILAGAIVLGGCNKEQFTANPGGVAKSTQKGEFVKDVTLTQSQARSVKDMRERMPKLRFWDEANHRFIEMSNGSRDLIFSDPDEGFNFDDPDNNGVILFSDGSGDYIVFSTGFGVAGSGGGGVVVAGNTALNIDYTMCLSAQAIADGDGFGSIFDTGFAFDEYAAVFGIAGDFEELADADTESDNFNPFDYFQGFAMYYVLSDDISGSHEVFDWLGATEDDDFDDLASSFVMDFSNFSLYFATSGTLTVSGGQMNFNGEYLAIEDLFEAFLDDDFNEDDLQASVVTGFGMMGCN